MTDKTKLALLAEEIERMNFIVDYLYDSLGPAADEIMDMAQNAWEESQ